MSNQKPTGNWRAYESVRFKGEWGVETDDPSMVGSGDEIIVHPCLSKELAHLITAIPELLEAAKAHIRMREAQKKYFRTRWRSDLIASKAEEKTADTLAAIAIAKAEGRP